MATVYDALRAGAALDSLRQLLDSQGRDNPIVVLSEGQRLESLGEDQLAAVGLQRAGSWRDRPPLL